VIQLDCTLVSDGSSDRALIPILKWLLQAHGAYPAHSIEWYDPSRFKHPPKSLPERIDHAVENYPCDLLFIHRDAEDVALTRRVAEVRKALSACSSGENRRVPAVLVIPVRMMEAWLLFDEARIRRAAGCPQGNTPLDLPKLRRCEDLADPKERLHRCLRVATQQRGRRLKKFNVDAAIHRVAELIPDFSPLRTLPAFQRLESELRDVLSTNHWV
jgi:hypothetical protein